MPTEAKKATVAELKNELSNAKAMIVADYRGLTVSDISAVRRNLRGEGITYRVVKNRLAKIAAQEAGSSELNELLEGPIGAGDHERRRGRPRAHVSRRGSSIPHGHRSRCPAERQARRRRLGDATGHSAIA